MMKNLFLNILILVVSISITSCDTDIPEIDTTPPTFSFKITGDGFDRTFTEDDDFSTIQLNLKEGTSYDILLSGVDNGGVRRIQLEIPSDYMNLQTPINSPWQENNSGFTKTISWNGSENNPVTANIFSGTFIANGDQVSTSTYVRVEDFGGKSGPPFNITEGTLTIYIAPNQTTEVVDL